MSVKDESIVNFLFFEGNLVVYEIFVPSSQSRKKTLTLKGRLRVSPSTDRVSCLDDKTL